MRPDDHKKKRSAQYKKKKGAKGGKPENRVAEGKGSGRGDPKSRPAPSEWRQQQQRSPAAGVANQNTTSSSDEEQFVSSNRQTFKRREIVSNWNRYEVTETESLGEKSTPAAVDYTKLLNVAGNASSHFRFKHEADWEEELSSFSGNQNQTTHVLGIDCADLGSSLQCLPLFERLGLSADLFPEEQRELLKQDAIKHRQEFCKTRVQTSQSGELTPTGQSLWVENEGILEGEHDGQIHRQSNKLPVALMQHNDKGLSGNEIIDLKPKEQTQQNETKCQSDSTMDNICVVDRTKHNDHIQGKRSKQVAVSARLEEELDLLLSMDLASADCNPQSLDSRESVSQSVTDDTDVHQNREKSSDAGAISDPTERKDKGPGATPQENLEDWLDSILDD